MTNEQFASVVLQILEQRARQRTISGLGRRRILVRKMKDDFKVNRHDIDVNPLFIMAAENPLDPADRILDAMVAFDWAESTRRAEKINEVKSKVLKWVAYLERTLPFEEFQLFMDELEVMSVPPLLEKRALDARIDSLLENGFSHDPLP